jgi:uncharacterized protein (UPF0218 family)
MKNLFTILTISMTVLVLSNKSLGQVQFTPHTIKSDAAGGDNSVYAVDVDGDGDNDVLSVESNSYSNGIRWYENDGNENFTTHTITTNMLGANSVYAIDVDGDEDIDMLCAFVDAYEGGIVWYENDGNKNFTSHTIASGEDCHSVYAIDVDGDEDMDVLSAGYSDTSSTISWYENDGNENFTHQTISLDVLLAWSVYAIDVDGDGDIDVLSASHNDNKIAWYENDGNEYFSPHIITTGLNGALSVYAIDMDGDGDVDVLSASQWDDKIAWYENDGNENFTSHIITTDAARAISVYTEDVDGDGDMDVLSASIADDKIAWYENDGNENFTTHIITVGADGAWSVYAIDVDGDGNMDVLSASQNDNQIAWYENLSAPIPAELTAFTASISKSSVTLNWATATETNNSGFELQRKLEITDWEIIGFIEGHGTTTEAQEYFYIDDIRDISATTFSYRLKQIDFNGSFEYSKVVEVTKEVPTDYSLDQNYPNPFNATTVITYRIPIKSFVTIKVYNSLGKEVQVLINEEKVAGSHRINFDAASIPSGVYIYQIQVGSYIESKKMVLMK